MDINEDAPLEGRQLTFFIRHCFEQTHTNYLDTHGSLTIQIWIIPKQNKWLASP